MTREIIGEPQPDKLSDQQKKLVLRLWQLGAIRINLDIPWVLNSGRVSPIYADLRLLQSDPLDSKKDTLQLLLEIMKNLEYDCISGILTSPANLASSLSDMTGKPQITPRVAVKGHGRGNRIDGIYRQGNIAVLLEDASTTGLSLEDALKVLLGEGIVVNDAITVCDRQEGATERLAQYGIRLHSVFNLQDALPFYASQGLITQQELDGTMQYFQSQQTQP